MLGRGCSLSLPRREAESRTRFELSLGLKKRSLTKQSRELRKKSGPAALLRRWVGIDALPRVAEGVSACEVVVRDSSFGARFKVVASDFLSVAEACAGAPASRVVHAPARVGWHCSETSNSVRGAPAPPDAFRCFRKQTRRWRADIRRSLAAAFAEESYGESGSTMPPSMRRQVPVT